MNFSPPTFWRGVEAPARRVRVRVGAAPARTYWCAELEGEVRDAIEITADGATFFIDDADGEGWNVVTRRFASGGYQRLPDSSIVVDVR